ncbi:MAG: hypothetical protein IAE95_05265 [Chitinophagaceae bacterium]|nr:hypothetical protein [Chitinophagaceae bacterium]
MANAVENALNRASDEQRARAQQAIEEARANIKLVSMQPGDVTASGANSIAHNAQVIEEAKRNIPFETMQHVDEIGPPLTTPSANGQYTSKVVELHPNVQSTIENIEQGEGNNYLRENAVDRAMTRPSQDIQRDDQQQALGR